MKYFYHYNNCLIERVTQYFVTVRFRYGQNLHTSQHGQAHTIQIVRTHARDLTMAAAGQAYGLAPVCDRYNIQKYIR